MGRISAPWTLDGHQFSRSDGWYCGILVQHVQEKTIILFCGPPYTPPHCFRSITGVLVVHNRFAHWTNGIELLNQLLKIVRVQNDSFWQNEQKKEAGLIQQTSDMGRGRSQQVTRCEGLQRFDKCVDILTQVPYVPLQFVPCHASCACVVPEADPGCGMVRAGQPEWGGHGHGFGNQLLELSASARDQQRQMRLQNFQPPTVWKSKIKRPMRWDGGTP